VPLLSCSNNYAQSNLSTGNWTKTDTTVVVPISYIKLANEKMIERNYYMELCAEQDTLINNQIHYIDCQNNNISLLNKEIKRRKKYNIWLACTTIIFFITSLFK